METLRSFLAQKYFIITKVTLNNNKKKLSYIVRLVFPKPFFRCMLGFVPLHSLSDCGLGRNWILITKVFFCIFYFLFALLI